MPALNVPTADPSNDNQLDFLSLGSLVTRLDPGIQPFRRARSLDIHVSGGEYNVSANLASCFGQRTGVATAMVDYGMGELVQGRVREMGVRPFYKHFEHDGVRGPNIATVYSDRGLGVRAPVVFYNRANEAGAMLGPGDFDWKKIFSETKTRWFHSGGIYAALGANTSDLIIEGMKAAGAAGAIRSFDLNYRAKLWKTLEGGEKHGIEQNRKIAAELDVLIGNEEDLQLGLGYEGQDVHAKSKLDPEAFFAMIERVKADFPNIKAVATTLREVESTNRHNWAAVLWVEGERFVSPTMKLDVVDRIGGGDGFASGVIYGLLNGEKPEQALRLGWAHGALLTTFPGDVSIARLDEVEQLAKGGTARVQR
ncbi:2-dehydro-3-deoxygluconokinase [Pseudobythopirellula maris]|uniref:2-dehydro-3-deoxygluconokinase n=1 Tax=Pseudobythopirellula maris TaxID=2527991 RepID=A0A5C5ZH04_9BACT|nr:sugar kinase [Pseudobythopirellula maris]TWT86612.1 2-dehydro-3-deoxygluconokinase [Pseudobythopirellula maris]